MSKFLSGDDIQELFREISSPKNSKNLSLVLDKKSEELSWPAEALIKALFNAACEQGNVECVKLLLQEPRSNPSAHNYPLFISIMYGHTENVQALVNDKRTDLTYDYNYPLRLASQEGKAGIVEILLLDKKVDPTAKDNDALRKASRNGHHAVVEILLKDTRVNPAAKANQAIVDACEKGHTKVVQLLLNDVRVNPAVDNLLALRLAKENKHAAVVAEFNEVYLNAIFTIFILQKVGLPEDIIHHIIPNYNSATRAFNTVHPEKNKLILRCFEIRRQENKGHQKNVGTQSNSLLKPDCDKVKITLHCASGPGKVSL